VNVNDVPQSTHVNCLSLYMLSTPKFMPPNAGE